MWWNWIITGIIIACLPSSCSGSSPKLVESHAPQNSSTGTKCCWVYLHLQKSGGTTVKAIMFDTVRNQRRDLYNTEDWKKGQLYTDAYVRRLMSMRSKRMVYGSSVEAMRASTYFENKCKHFTVFRHPVHRLVSGFFFCKVYKTAFICARDVLNENNADHDLLSFAQHWGNYALRQFALGMVSADDVLSGFSNGTLSLPGKASWEPTPDWYLLKVHLKHANVGEGAAGGDAAALESYLSTAQDVIRNQYSAVGILEEFDTTVKLFDAALEMPRVRWQSSFASLGAKNKDVKYKEEEAAALASALDDPDIRELLRLDILLYEFALGVFREQLLSYGIPFNESG